MSKNEPATNQELKIHIETLEKQLAESKSQLEKSERELDLLLYYLSHDLRAPLRGIDGYSQALLEDFGSAMAPMAKAYLEYIRDSSKRLSILIDGLLRLSRIERTKLEITTVDLRKIAQAIFCELKNMQPSSNIEVCIANNLTVKADSSLMQILIRCLLENAFKFTSRCPEAKIEFGKINSNGKEIFFIKDNGAGFNMADSSRLFVPFQRLHSQPEFEGLGLGLAIAQRIVSRHKGRIWAEGEPDIGATFYFCIKTTKKEQSNDRKP
jgi:light-regulated signal transduction histidine kinase (bacteriophytochrome)